MINLLIAVQSRQKSSMSISVLFGKEKLYIPVLYEGDEDFIICCLCKKILELLGQTSQKSAELDKFALRVLKLLAGGHPGQIND